MVKSACGCRRVAPAVRAVICGLPEPNKLQICPESCFGLQGLGGVLGALVSARVRLGGEVRENLPWRAVFQAANPAGLQALQIFFGMLVCYRPLARTCCVKPPKRVYAGVSQQGITKRRATSSHTAAPKSCAGFCSASELRAPAAKVQRAAIDAPQKCKRSD